MTDVTQTSDTYADLGGGLTPDTPDTPACICGGTGGLVERTVWTATGPRDVVQVCLACRPDAASRVRPLAELHAPHRSPRRRWLALVR